MNKLPIPGIDAYMGDGAAVSGEENQIPGLKTFLADICTMGVLSLGGAVRGVAQCFEYVINKPGTVKTGWGSAAVNIRCAEIFLGLCHNGLSGE